MEYEVGAATRLGVMLIAIAALISIVWVTVKMGNGIKNESFNEADHIQTSVEQSQLRSLQYKEDVIIPKAAVYNLVAQCSNNIDKLVYTDDTGAETTVTFGESRWEATGKINGQFLAIEDVLENEMVGKAKVYVEKSGTDAFKVTVETVE